jgi:FkbM family methyltransferase
VRVTGGQVSFKSKSKKIAEKISGAHIYRSLPRGTDFFVDVRTSLPKFRADVVFDVGANVGQSAKQYLKIFPNSRIYSFEPVSETFHRLEKNLEGNERVRCYRLAFGSSAGIGEMVLQGSSDMFFLRRKSSDSPVDDDLPVEAVEIDILDQFCRRHRIDRINYLKIDTEGGDLSVLEGAVDMLTEHRIDLVKVEAGMNPDNTRHVSLEALKAFLESYGYFLFGIYEQVSEWPNEEPHLRRTNPVFISKHMIEINRRQ